MFGTIKQRFDKHVVIPDLHGETVLLQKAVEQYYDEEDVGFVLLGDVIDRRGKFQNPEEGVRATLEIIRQLGNRAVMTMANHEWYLLGSVLCRNTVHRQAIQEAWLQKRFGNSTSMEQNTLASYGLANDGLSSASELWDKMQSLGHTKVLTKAAPYYETDTFIAVHAGLQYDKPWEDQKVELDLAAAQMSNAVYEAMPDQWFDGVIATDATENHATDKIIVSGHAHYLIPNPRYVSGVKLSSDQRSLYGGRRIRLASQMNEPIFASLFVWQDWDGQVLKINR